MENQQNRDDEITIARLKDRIDYLITEVEELKKRLDAKYVTQDQFAPVRIIAFGLVGLIMVGVIGALMTLILKGAGK